MKKILFVAILAAASVMVYAQPRAIGGRLGAFEGVSYEHALGESNMIEVELGLGVGGANSWGETEGSLREHYTYSAPSLQAAFTYDWIDPFGKKFPWEHKGEWHWYMGVGAAAGYGWGGGAISYRAGSYRGTITGLNEKVNWGFVGAAGRIGVEYDFWFPLQLSVDYRPVLGLGMMNNQYMYDKTKMAFHWDVYDIALSVRYKF